MSPAAYQIRQCRREGCGLRYPVVEGQTFTERCPRCRATTQLALERSLEVEPWQASPLPSAPSTPTPSPLAPRPLILHAFLDNIRSAWNVGSMFRTADGAGISHLHLCGITPTPEIAAVGKTALGAELSVEWGYAPDGVARADELLSQGSRLWALEQGRYSLAIAELRQLAGGDEPLVLVVGNEICGVDPDILERCERIVHIPMLGGKRSLNVAVAFGIAVFTLRTKYLPPSNPASEK